MILYVTSFNKKLYEATGKNMIESFVKWKVEGDLLITFEDSLDLEIPKHRKFLFHNLDQDPFLKNWLDQNKDIIPTHLGGSFDGKFANVFNTRAASWFRKIVAIRASLDKGYDKIIFVDSDSVFKMMITENYVEEVLEGNSMFYHLGKLRRKNDMGIESGFIGWDLNNGGREYLNLVINSFDSGEFRKYTRWDDGYVFRMIVEENPQIKTKDLTKDLESTIEVVPNGPFKNFVTHHKGVHWRQHGVAFNNK